MLKISWLDRVTNRELLKECGWKVTMEKYSKKRKEWIGHIIRHERLLKLIIEEKNHREDQD